MRLLYINPNATEAMTESIASVARAALPGAEITGVTNRCGPPSIEGPDDGARAVPGVLALLGAAEADAVVIACFDDTGLAEARAAASCPVLGIGQSAYAMAGLLGLRFSVVTSLAISVPVILANIESGGFGPACASVRASGLPVLEIDAGGDAALARLAEEIDMARREDGADAVVLGCAGMAPLAEGLATRTGMRLIDGVAASAHLAAAAAGFSAPRSRPPYTGH